VSPSYTGAVLLKIASPRDLPDQELRLALKVLALECIPLAESVALHLATEGSDAYAYLFARESGALTPAVLAGVRARVRALPVFEGCQVGAERLQPVFDLSGASRAEEPRFHYVVEIDVPPEHEADLEAWYDQEHMPGLAACPGTVRARRFRNPDGSPRHHSCYDLVRAETLQSAPWLAVRNTAWAGRVRPHFRNTRRTMFKRIFESEL
jgi:hypothetical protein